MASVNKVIILGNLGRDPEVRSFPNGDQVCNVAIATTDKWKDKSSGEQMEATEWHKVSFFGRLAEIAGQYLRKGSQCYVEGSLKTRKYTDKDGVEKYTTEIRADRLQLLGEPRQGGDNQRQSNDRGGNNDQRQQAQPTPQQGQPERSPGQRSNQTQQRQQPAQNGNGKARPSTGFDDMDDDIPF